jgi:hypothetical protein
MYFCPSQYGADTILNFARYRMVNGDDLQLLRSGEKVLLHFLHDALSSITEDYFAKIVVPYVNSDQYQGTAKAYNARGVAKTSLKEFDLQFLLQLFEFSVDRRKPMALGIVMPNLTSFLPLTQNTVYYKIRSAITVRNDWVHAETSAIDETRRAINITKLLDLFREEILHVVLTREDMFSTETREVAKAYADELTAAMLRKPVEEPPMKQDVIINPEPILSVESSNESANLSPSDSWMSRGRTRSYLLAVVGAILIGGLLLSWFLGQKSEKATPTLHVAACESVTTQEEASTRKNLSALIGRYSLQRVVVHSSDNPQGTVFDVGNTDSELDSVIRHLGQIAKLEDAFQIRTLFKHVIPAMKNAGESNSVFLVLGSVGDFTKQEEQALHAVPDTLFPDGTGSTLRKSKAPLLFLSLGRRTASDDSVLNGFKEAEIRCEQLAP